MPDWAELLRPRLARLRLSPEREAEIIDELGEHLEQRYEELRREASALPRPAEWRSRNCAIRVRSPEAWGRCARRTSLFRSRRGRPGVS